MFSEKSKSKKENAQRRKKYWKEWRQEELVQEENIEKPRAGEIEERKKMSMEIMEKRKNWKRDKEDENKGNCSK